MQGVMIRLILLFFFFNDTATTEIYTLSLHDALPICHRRQWHDVYPPIFRSVAGDRSEEHTSELQSLRHLVCRLLLEKKKNHKSNLVYFHTLMDDIVPDLAVSFS